MKFEIGKDAILSLVGIGLTIASAVVSKKEKDLAIQKGIDEALSAKKQKK